MDLDRGSNGLTGSSFVRVVDDRRRDRTSGMSMEGAVLDVEFRLVVDDTRCVDASRLDLAEEERV